jgi:hypothetical protein
VKVLKTHPNDGIALRAALEEALLDVKYAKGNLRAGSREEARSLSRLLGFLEGRLRINAPDWWRKMVIGAEFDAKNFRFLFDAEKETWHRVPGFSPCLPKNVHFQKCHNRRYLKIDGETRISLPSKLRKDIPYGDSGVLTVASDNENCYSAVYFGLTGGFTLHCSDRRSGKDLWEADVLGAAGGLLRGGSGPGYHRVTLLSGDSVLYVFGGESDGAYVEGFDKKSGKVRFRFSTGY